MERYKVDFDTPVSSVISVMEYSFVLYNAIALFSLSDSVLGLPPNLPLALAAFKPYAVLSESTSLSNWDKLEIIVNNNLPVGDVVSIVSLSDTNLILFWLKNSISSARFLTDLPNHESDSMTIVSPDLISERRLSSSGLFFFVPEIFSQNILSTL